MSTGHNNL